MLRLLSSGRNRRGRRAAVLFVVTGVAVLLVLGADAAVSRSFAAGQDCVRAAIVLWGDGRHDDGRALNAWLRGEDAIWADSGSAVGATISGRHFRLSEPVYVTAGTGRTLHDFRLEWPERGEIVSGGTIAAGSNPDAAPALTAVHIVGGDPGEGVPFEMPDSAAATPDPEASCATS